MQQLRKKPTNLSLDPALLRDARALGVNISQAAEQGLQAAVRDARAAAWQAENAARMTEWGQWAEAQGLPLSKHRQF